MLENHLKIISSNIIKISDDGELDLEQVFK